MIPYRDITDIILDSKTSTARFGRILGELCEPGDIICLDGELGAGKTTLAQSIAVGVGIDEREYVTSPSFAVLHEYRGSIPLYHMDFYRLFDSDDILDLGLEEYFYLSGVTMIEWPQRAQSIIPEGNLLVSLTVLDEDSRAVSCSSSSLKWQEKLKQLHGRYFSKS